MVVSLVLYLLLGENLVTSVRMLWACRVLPVSLLRITLPHSIMKKIANLGVELPWLCVRASILGMLGVKLPPKASGQATLDF